MTTREKLDDAAIADQLSSLEGWIVAAGKLHKEYRFRDFNEAFGFMARCALHSEQLNHHPEWFNVWSTVRVDLATHDAGGITDLDFQLARRMEAVAGSV